MMTTKEELQALLERVEKATGPDREIDADISSVLLGWHIKREPGNRRWRHGKRGGKWFQLPSYTGSIDCSVGILRTVMAGFAPRLDFDYRPRCYIYQCDGYVMGLQPGNWVSYADAETMPLAVIEATLRHLIAQKETE